MENELKKLKESIAGEFVYSQDISGTFKKWRNIFEIGQKKLAMKLDLKVSTISDYENGRRQNPGSKFLKNYIDAIVQIDLDNGSKILKGLIPKSEIKPIYIREFNKFTSFDKIQNKIKIVDVKPKKINENIYGFTYININEIESFEISNYFQIFGKTNKRILIFSKPSDMLYIKYTLKILKYQTGQMPIAIIIEDNKSNISKYLTELNINLPIYLTENDKDEILLNLNL